MWQVVEVNIKFYKTKVKVNCVHQHLLDSRVFTSTLFMAHYLLSYVYNYWFNMAFACTQEG